MKIIIGITLLLIAISMRSWGRSKYYIPETLQPFYQTRGFWILFSIICIAFLIGGGFFLISGLIQYR